MFAVAWFDNDCYRPTNHWGTLDEVPVDVSSETIRKLLFGRSTGYDPAYLMPDSEAILESQRKKKIFRNQAWTDYSQEAVKAGKLCQVIVCLFIQIHHIRYNYLTH